MSVITRHPVTGARPGLDLEGEVVIQAAKERPGLAGFQFGITDEDVATIRQPLIPFEIVSSRCSVEAG